LAGYIPRWFTGSHMVTHPSTNRARSRITSLIETNALPLNHATYRNQPDNTFKHSDLAHHHSRKKNMQKMQTTNQEYNVAMVVSCCQVKRCVVSHVSCINADTTTHKHFNNVVPAHHRRPMQQTKPVLISTMFSQKLTISSQ